jgi:hypothetical protein
LRLRTDPEPWNSAEIGDCWYFPGWTSNDPPAPIIRQHFLAHQASRQYVDHWLDERPPLIVWLPPGFGFSPDERYRGGGRWGLNPQCEGWNVLGSLEAGDLSVTPSINVVGAYHGSIVNGVISDDLEGRTFESPPRFRKTELERTD